MPSKKGFLIPIFSTVAMLALGLAVAFYLPLPEERAARELSKVEVGPVRWSHVTAKTAVAELNAQLEKANRSPYRVILAEREEPYDDITLSLELKDPIPATECARYIAELSGSAIFATRDGLVIDGYDQGRRYDEPSLRRIIRFWATDGVRVYFQKKPEPSVADPFAAP